jgi:transcriptional regulator with AAA-type ATPase domain
VDRRSRASRCAHRLQGANKVAQNRANVGKEGIAVKEDARQLLVQHEKRLHHSVLLPVDHVSPEVGQAAQEHVARVPPDERVQAKREHAQVLVIATDRVSQSCRCAELGIQTGSKVTNSMIVLAV